MCEKDLPCPLICIHSDDIWIKVVFLLFERSYVKANIMNIDGATHFERTMTPPLARMECDRG